VESKNDALILRERSWRAYGAWCRSPGRVVMRTIGLVIIFAPMSAQASQTFMYCDAPTPITSLRPATGPSQAEQGYVRLRGGAAFEITTPYVPEPDPSSDFARQLRKTDHIQLCFGPPQHFMGAGSRARLAIVGDVETGASMYAIAYPRP
jgi:hypothetical protein